jgi:hypothetical protein
MIDIFPERIFRRSDPDFPTTPTLQQRLVAAGRVEGEGPNAPRRTTPLATHEGPAICLGHTVGDNDPVHMNLAALLGGRLLIQGSSGAGKSSALRHIVEEAQDALPILLLDPEAEFAGLAQHIGAETLAAATIADDGLTAAALRARAHRLPLHLDLSDLEPDVRIRKAAAFLAGLLASPREHWGHTALVCIDEAHLLAPHLAASARDAETRRLGVATLTDLCARGRKRGLCPVVATQRLAKLAASVVSELHNVLIGLNVFDRDVARAGDLLGFGADRAAALRTLAPGEFFGIGPAISQTPRLIRVTVPVTEHAGATPVLTAPADVAPGEARGLLGLDELPGDRHAPLPGRGRGGGPSSRTLDAFLLDPSAAPAARIVAALRKISPNATTTHDLANHLQIAQPEVDAALDLLAALGAADTMPRGSQTRIARLSARLRVRAADVPPVVGLA